MNCLEPHISRRICIGSPCFRRFLYRNMLVTRVSFLSVSFLYPLLLKPLPCNIFLYINTHIHVHMAHIEMVELDIYLYESLQSLKTYTHFSFDCALSPFNIRFYASCLSFNVYLSLSHNYTEFTLYESVRRQRQ